METTCATHLHFIEEAIGEQRADRAIDEARVQRLFFGGATFTLEETTRDAARGVGLLDVVDGQGEEVLAGHGLLGGYRGDEHHGVAHRDQHRGRGLAGDFAGFDGDGVLTKLK
jgi:GNAT superfamily N-acetyltransferase